MFPVQGGSAENGNVNYTFPPPVSAASIYGLPTVPNTTIIGSFNPNFNHAPNNTYVWPPPEVTILQNTQVVQIHTDGYLYGNPVSSYGHQYWHQQAYPAPAPSSELPPGTWYGQPAAPALPPPPVATNYSFTPVNISPAVQVAVPPSVPAIEAKPAEEEPHSSKKRPTDDRDRLRERDARDRHDQYRKRRRSPSPNRRSTRRRSRTRSPDRQRRRDDHHKPDHKHSNSSRSTAKTSAGDTDKIRRRQSDTRRSPPKQVPKEKHQPSKENARRSEEVPKSSQSAPRRSQVHSSRTSQQRRSPPRRHSSRPRDRSRSRSRPKQSSSRQGSIRTQKDSRAVEASKKEQSSLSNASSSSTTRLRENKIPITKEAELGKTSEDDDDELDEILKVDKWVRSAPAELFYIRDASEMKATERTKLLCKKFETNLLDRAKTARLEAEILGAAKMKELMDMEAEEYGDDDDTSSSDSGESSSEEEKSSKPNRGTAANRELERRKLHPKRLHLELWHNDPGLMNDGPVCRCSAKARRFGIRHGFYPGEDIVYRCEPYSNNPSRLFHYRITITPAKNFLVNSPTVITHDGHEYLFEGFSLFSHYELDLKLPPCKVIRFNIRYDVFIEQEAFPESFCVNELNLFENYLFREILELVDLKQDWDQETGCSQFHLMPRFVRELPDNGKEILSMNRVLLHLLKHDKELVKEEDLARLLQVEQKEWQNFADKHKGMLVTKWGMKPCALRVDQIDREIAFDKDGSCNSNEDGIPYPLIVHFGIRPPQLSYAGNSGYQRAWRRYVKYRHLLSNMPKPSIEEKRKLVAKDLKLRQMRTASTMKRDVTVDISSKGFRTTGICCDIVQHAMLIPVLVGHLRFHKSLVTLEQRLEYTFLNPYLLQLAMTHPSYRENFGTNPDHARNALTNCGIRQPEYGDRRIHYSSTRKRGINTLINIMARFGAEDETESEITHNERLEFLGDAVVEFATSIHLFHLFPDLEEGGLATYRAAIVQNQHLAELAQNLQLDQFMLYAHGSDLCHDSELRHAMANCFEALMGAVFLDGGIEVADRIFGKTLFGTDAELYDIWTNYPKHPLQAQEPKGDRHWILSHGGVLKKLTEFEELIGLEFTHIRLLARAFTDRSLGYNHLSRGSNQRLEFLGDTVLQLISSEYLYRHFPDHHEGHLSLLRSSLVNNRTQSLVCDDLGMTNYAMRGDPKLELKTKDRADLLEAFLGALYIDKGLKYCIVFCSVCFIPRLSTSIIKQEWNDPKSKLQQCCLTLRTMDGNEPDIPQYKITESKGPTNTRVYVVAVFFRGERLATAEGHSIQEAEMNAAANALRESEALFPQLIHQRRIIDKTNKK